jgi:hypothetical protein
MLRLSWRQCTTTVSRGVIAPLFSLDHWGEVRSLQRRVHCEPDFLDQASVTLCRSRFFGGRPKLIGGKASASVVTGLHRGSWLWRHPARSAGRRRKGSEATAPQQVPVFRFDGI